MRGVTVATALAAVLLLTAWGSARAEIEGTYRAIADVPESKSVKVVRFEEFLNFTCPHCNNFRKAAEPLKKKYGDRLEVIYVPILFGSGARRQPDWPLRLFFIAESLGRTEEVKNLIFDAAFQNGVNPYDPAVINYLARSSGLGDKFRAEADAAWVTEKVNAAQRRAAEAGVYATPTIVLQSALLVEPSGGLNAFVGNLDNLISQLLADPK